MVIVLRRTVIPLKDSEKRSEVVKKEWETFMEKCDKEY